MDDIMLIFEEKFGRLFIADIKTGSSVNYGALGFAVQLAIYATADNLYTQGAAADGSDDIVTRLRAKESDTNCWQCGEYGCLPADCNHWTRKPAPCVCAEHQRPPSPDGFVCACNCHEPSPLMLEAADEIERLQKDIQQRSLDHLTTIGELQTAADEIERLRALIVEWDDANNFGSLHGDDLTAAVDRLNASEKALIEEARRG